MAEKNDLHGLRVACLLTDGFEYVEYDEPRKALEEVGARVTVIAPQKGERYGMKHHDKHGTVNAEFTLDDADAAQFDAVLLPGGALNADALRIEPKAQEFVRAIDDAGKPIAVICHGPWLLVSADLADGRTITSYKTIQDDLRNAGAKWVDNECVRDGNWVSSRQPADIPAFNREMVKLFSEGAAKKRDAA